MSREFMQEFVRNALWPPGPLSKLGLILATLSMLALLQYGLQFGVGPAIGLVLDWYNRLLDILFGWAQPYIDMLVDRLANYFHLDIEVYGHWKHIFVLMIVYFWREARTDWNEGWHATAWFDFLFGTLIALTSGVAAGTVQVSATDMRAHFLIAAIPIAGLFVYDLAYMMWAATFLREQQADEFGEPPPTWWGDMRAGLPWLLGRTIGGYALLWLGLRMPLVQQLPSAGLVMLAFLIFALALYWLLESIISAAQHRGIGDDNQGESWSRSYWRTGTANMGAAMLGIFLWCGVFLLSNAGLSIYKL